MIVTDRKILRQISKETNLEEVEKLDLINKIKRANGCAWTEGCGLAAIQIGVPLRCSWFTYKGRETILINPVLSLGIGRAIEKEGCLSIPGKFIAIERFWEIEYLNNGKKRNAKGIKARIIQHEIDHMNGKLNDELEVSG